MRRSAIAALAAMALVTGAQAQSYPASPIRLVVPFAPGGGADLMARILAEPLGKRLGQPIVIENKPGGGATVGADYVAKATPDGYTLLWTTPGPQITNPYLMPKLPYDPDRDFTPVATVVTAVNVLVVTPSLPVKSVAELIAYAKANPGKLNFSSPGLASTTFIAGALFRKAAGINIVHVPFKSAPDAVTAVIRGDAHMYFAPVNLAREFSEAGKVRAIASATAERLPELPNVPTFKQAGLDYVYDSWFGLMAPAGVPRDIVAKINKDIVAILQSPETKEKLAKQFVEGRADTPEAFDKIIKDETAHLTEVFKETTN
jgi:tripartite-type tricarboxylate transporter receptor subunit TctC